MRGVLIRFSVFPCVSVALQVLVVDDTSRLLFLKIKKLPGFTGFLRVRVVMCVDLYLISVFDMCELRKILAVLAVLLKTKHYISILRYDEKISTVYLRLESTPDYSSRKIHPPEFGLKWLGQASSDPVFLKDQRNLGRLSSSEQWFCTLSAKSFPIWTRYGKDYKLGVRASSTVR